jgi:hypothetical protein
LNPYLNLNLHGISSQFQISNSKGVEALTNTPASIPQLGSNLSKSISKVPYFRASRGGEKRREGLPVGSVTENGPNFISTNKSHEGELLSRAEVLHAQQISEPKNSQKPADSEGGLPVDEVAVKLNEKKKKTPMKSGSTNQANFFSDSSSSRDPIVGKRPLSPKELRMDSMELKIPQIEITQLVEVVPPFKPHLADNNQDQRPIKSCDVNYQHDIQYSSEENKKKPSGSASLKTETTKISPEELFYENVAKIFGYRKTIGMCINGVDLEILNHLITHLKPQETSLNYGIIPNSIIDRKLLEFWNDKNDEYMKAEKEVQGLIDFFEGKRRSLALRKLLKKHVFSMKWKLIKKDARNQQFSRVPWKEFEQHYGISGIPKDFCNIPSPRFRVSKFQDQASLLALTALMGPENAKSRKDMTSYIVSKGYSSRWWRNFDLQNESDKFGLDVWKILEIGEALKFGSPDWHSNWENSPAQADLAYSHLLSIFLDEEKSLNIPWVESSEKAWLNSLPRNLYQERLKQLSSFILNSGKGSKLQWPNSEKTIDLIDPTLREDGYKLGYELIWLNNGLNLKKLSELAHNWSPLIDENPYKVMEMTPLERSTLVTCISISHGFTMQTKIEPFQVSCKKWFMKRVKNTP